MSHPARGGILPRDEPPRFWLVSAVRHHDRDGVCQSFGDVASSSVHMRP